MMVTGDVMNVGSLIGQREIKIVGEITNIAWCDGTFNPWWLCTEVGPGCRNCYAESLAKRYGYGWGQGAPRRFFGDKHWNEPLKWNEKAKREGKKKKVFCASMADWADNEVGQEHRDRLFALIKKTDWLIWQLLTKRIGNAKKMLPEDWRNGNAPTNIWFGITVVNQEEFDRDVPKLFELNFSVHWLSVEPQLGPINMTDNRNDIDWIANGIDWVVIGGESGPLDKVRPFDIGWARDGIRQCRELRISCFVKQLGARTFMEPKDGAPLFRTFSHAEAADPDRWPEDVRVRQFPEWSYQ